MLIRCSKCNSTTGFVELASGDTGMRVLCVEIRPVPDTPDELMQARCIISRDTMLDDVARPIMMELMKKQIETIFERTAKKLREDEEGDS